MNRAPHPSLPLPRDAFFGRARERAQLADALERTDGYVTLVRPLERVRRAGGSAPLRVYVLSLLGGVLSFLGVGTLQCLLQHDLVLGVAIYGGVRLGGFYGTRTQAAAGGLEQRLSSAGGVGQLGGLLIMPGPTVLLRGGLRADFIVGSDSPTNGVGPGAFFFTTQILFEVAIGLRFG